jgi:hypothetical protein
MTTSNTKETYLVSTVSGVLTAFLTLPFDFIKVRQQLTTHDHFNPSSRFFLEGRTITSAVGFGGLWTGLDSAILRQGIYSSARFFLYHKLVSDSAKNDRFNTVTVWQRTLYTALAGGFAGLLANPFDLILVRAQGDHLLPAEARRNYKNAFEGLSQIMVSEGGYRALFKGAYPNALRNATLNMVALPVYDQVKEYSARVFGAIQFIKPLSVFLASIAAGAFAMPFDNVRVRLQHDDVKNPAFKNAWECYNKILAREGFFGLYVGYWAFVTRTTVMYLSTIYFVDFLQRTFTSPK